VQDFNEYFYHDNTSGCLLWKKPSSKRTKVGDRVGRYNQDGFLVCTLKGKSYLVHKIIWYMHYNNWPNVSITHINGDLNDNRIENLRLYRDKILSSKDDLTQDILKDVIEYDYTSGKFFWKECTSASMRIGQEAGTIKRNRKASYKVIRIDTFGFYAHRLAWFYMTGKWPEQIDHINGDGLDNRWCNLREADNSKNSFNIPAMSGNKSGHKNVYYNKKSGNWVVAVTANYTVVHREEYETLEEAKNVACKVREQYHKEFCNHGTE